MSSNISQPKLDHLGRRIERVVMGTPVCDMHTHLYDPGFKSLLLWGIDDLLVYHYLVAEAYRYSELPSEKFWSMSKVEQADFIWDALFVKHSPISEACRGVLTTLNLLGLDVWKRDLHSLRRWFQKQNVEQHIDHCLEVAKVETVFMTNSPFDDEERPVWETKWSRDERFISALRIDPLLTEWETTVPKLSKWGYKVGKELTKKTIDEVQRFLRDWVKRMDSKYLMVSLPPEFVFPGNDACARLIEKVILPFCEAEGLPFALMLGVQRAVNPELRLAGDGVGPSDLQALANLCSGFPNNRFLVTVLALENQHRLAVLARKFRNLHPFGCWWFTNVPYAINEMSRLRLELLGWSFTAQHSDARVLDQLVYKWDHFRRVLVPVLSEKYAAVLQSGWEPTMQEIQRDVREILGGGFLKFCG